MKFIDLSLDDKLKQALQVMKYEELTPVQEKVIPCLLEKKSCIVQAQTGSGKTASYAIPIIQNIVVDQHDPQALILSPTRELCRQIKDHFHWLGMYKKIQCLEIFGKQPFIYQKEDLKQRCHVVSGTPGRILEHIKEGTFITTGIQYVVLDEADALMQDGFIEDVKEILSSMPKEATMCLLSATIDQEVLDFAKDKEYEIFQLEGTSSIQEYVYPYENKLEDVCQILMDMNPDTSIIFCQRQQTVDELYDSLQEYNVSCAAIHGGMVQEERLRVMKDFKKGKIRILISTDVSARGIDVEKVNLIINYDRPDSKAIYKHRIGRSGRVQEVGISITLVKQLPANVMVYTLSEKKAVNKENMKPLSFKPKEKTDVTKELRKDIQKIYINAGKNKKIRAGDIVGALCSIDGIQMDDIGIIQVQDHQTYVDILNGKGKIVLKQLKTIKKKSVKVQKAHQ